MPAELIPPTIVMIILSLLGDFGNLSIVWSTIRDPNLKSHCNILIAFNAFADTITQLGNYIFAVYLFSGILTTNRITCYYLQCVPIFGSMCGLFLTLAIGLDRLIGIKAPLL